MCKITLIIFLLTFCIGQVVGQSGPLTGSGGGIIAFLSNRDGTRDIYLMNADGSDQTRITNNSAFEFDLAWSPDGSRLAFISSLHSGFELYYMHVIDITNGDFSSPVRLTNNAVMDMSPTWSPDGSQIAFSSGGTGIVIINIDGSIDTTINTSSLMADQPSWSPVANIIAFSGHITNNLNIYTISTQSTNMQQLTFHNSDLVPNWSPDGNKIAYVSTYNNAEDIFIINSDGSDDHRITTSPENDFVPDWSPHGERLVYEGSVIGVDQICVIDTNGLNYQQLTTQGVNAGPAWYPVAGINRIGNETNDQNLPNNYRLCQNYPNPFNSESIISFELDRSDHVTLAVYSISGSLIDMLIDKRLLNKGFHSVKFNAVNLPSGIYFYVLKSIHGHAITRKMCLIK